MPDVNTRQSEFIELVSVDKTVSPETTSKIGGITDMPSVLSQFEEVEDTTINDGNRHRKLGIGDPPSVSLTVFWDPEETPQNELRTAHNNKTEGDYRVRFTDVSPAEEFEFKAYVQAIGTPYAGINGVLQADVTFRLNENDQGEIVTHNPNS